MYSFAEKKNSLAQAEWQPSRFPVTTNAVGRRACARAVFIMHMHIRADHVTSSIS